MTPKQLLFALIFFMSATFVFQVPKPTLGFGESRSAIRNSDDQRLALNKVEYKQLMKLERQLKSKEAQLAKIRSQKKTKKKGKT